MDTLPLSYGFARLLLDRSLSLQLSYYCLKRDKHCQSKSSLKKSEIKENCFCRCKLTTQVWASPLRQGQYGKSWANESQGTSSLNNWKPERQKKQEISSGFCAKTCSEKRNRKKDNPVRLADYATVGSHRFEPFAFTKG